MSHNATPRLAAASLAATAAGLTAMAAFYITAGRPLVLPLLALGLIGPHLFATRLPRVSFNTWILRLLAFGGVAVLNPNVVGTSADWLIDARTANTLGMLCAAELMLQGWRVPPPGELYNGLMLFYSGLLFLAAANTFDDRFIGFLTPVFVCCTMVALRELRPRAAPRAAAGRMLPVLRRTFACAMVLLLGSSVQFLVELHHNQLMTFGLDLLMAHDLPPQPGGLSNQPELGIVFKEQESPQRVLRIDGPLDDPHLRAMAFDSYSNGRWSPPVGERKLISMSDAQLRSGVEGPHTQITRLVHAGGLLFAPLCSAGIAPPPGDDVQWNQEGSGPLKTLDPTPYVYDIVRSGDPAYQGPLAAPPTPQERSLYLEVGPEVDPRVAALAQRITARAASPLEKVRAVETYLLTHYKYSRFADRGREDPVSSFLLLGKSAYCEYFASAAAILLRTVGVPTRYVTGYYAHETAGGVSTVRQRDAHAWAESWIKGLGWVTVEATPAEGRPDHDSPVSVWMRAWEWLQDASVAARDRISNLSRLQLSLIMLGALLLWAAERWRNARRRVPDQAEIAAYNFPDAELAALAHRYEKLMQRQALQCPAGSTWAEFLDLEIVEESGRFDAAAHREFVNVYTQVRFGHPEDRGQLQRLEGLIRDLERSGQRLPGNGARVGPVERAD